ncbi:hypothetical protein ADK38_43500, partial [Streptomyces varsoviensis]
GELDVAALEAALGDVADRHESLRTVFPDIDGVPRQRVLEGEAGRPRLVTVAAEEEQLDQALTEHTRHAFDVGTELPWRVRLFTLSATRSVLLIVAHHIASDGWSMGVLGRDVQVAYAARHAGQAPDWSPLPVQYADYALWQRGALGELGDPESLAARQMDYWRAALADSPQELALPFDRPRPAVPSFRSGSVPVRVDAATHA